MWINISKKYTHTHTHTHTHTPENHGKGHKGPTKSTLTTCELIQLQAI